MEMIGILALLAAAGTVLWHRRRTRKQLENLNRMLDKAMEGSFTEEDFDETLLSAVETKLARYLAASTVSARNLQREKDSVKTLIADISHQTKTPIANILLYTQLLQEQDLPGDSRVCTDALESQVGKLQALIEALVKASRLESGIIALRPQPGVLAPVIHSAMAQLAPKAARKGSTVTHGNADGSGVLDPKWPADAQIHLLANSVTYTPAGGTVHISVKEYPMFATIEVSDSGPGIPEEEQASIFQRFYRGAAHSQEDGVGIGLYLVRKIAQEQGGYVKVSSNPGGGSTFSLYLPKT